MILTPDKSLSTFCSREFQWLEWSVESDDDGSPSCRSCSTHPALGQRQANQLDVGFSIFGRYVVHVTDGWSWFGSRLPQRLPRSRQRIHVHRIDSQHRLSIPSKSPRPLLLPLRKTCPNVTAHPVRLGIGQASQSNQLSYQFVGGRAQSVRLDWRW